MKTRIHHEKRKRVIYLLSLWLSWWEEALLWRLLVCVWVWWRFRFCVNPPAVAVVVLAARPSMAGKPVAAFRMVTGPVAGMAAAAPLCPCGTILIRLWCTTARKLKTAKRRRLIFTSTSLARWKYPCCTNWRGTKSGLDAKKKTTQPKPYDFLSM